MALTEEQIRFRRARARQQAEHRHARRRRLALLGAAVAIAVLAAAVTLGAAGGKRPRPGQAASAQPPHTAGGTGGSRLAKLHAGRPQTPAAPLGPIPPAKPGAAHIVGRGSPTSGEVALSFDDGFCAACVARIVDVLWRTGAHATFFPNGTYKASWAPQAQRIRAMVARGQIVVGNHTFTHHDPRTESADAFATDLARNESWIQNTFGITGRPWFRPPYGSFNADTLDRAGRQGYDRVVLWSGTLADSSPQTIPYLLKATRDWGHPGVIILAHGNYPNTGRALARIIGILRARHLRLVTLAELLGPPGAGPG